MEHHVDPFEHFARWVLLITVTALLAAVATALVLGKVSYWAGGVTATALYTMARLAHVVPGDPKPRGGRRRGAQK